MKINKNVLTSKTFLIAVLIVVIGFLLFFLVRPVLLGYSVYKQIDKSNYSLDEFAENLDELKKKIMVAEINLSSCYDFNKKLLSDLREVSDQKAECETKLEVSNLNYQQLKEKCEQDLEMAKEEYNRELNAVKEKCEEDLAAINDELAQKIEDYNNLKEQYELIVENMANNICCKAKVDNPRIKYYKVQDNKIVCVEEGENAISCPI